MSQENTSDREIFDRRIMLLGAGSRLKDRQDIRLELIQKGYQNIIIMENMEDNPTDRSLDAKFGRIVGTELPDFFFALFHKEARMDGVTFEIGWLCNIFTAREMSRRLRILYQEGYQWTDTTAYIPSLFVGVPNMPFNESETYSKASTYIEKCMMWD
jgi:hypothetical protein